MKHDYCVACGNTENLHQHHLVPRSVGGSDDSKNFVTLCNLCHGNVHGISMKWHTSELISTRTKAALKVLKDKGVQLGNRTNLDEARLKSNETVKQQATAFADNVLPLIKDLRDKGETLQAIAKRLNDTGMKTRRGGQWHHATVANILKRA